MHKLYYLECGAEEGISTSGEPGPASTNAQVYITTFHFIKLIFGEEEAITARAKKEH